MMLQDKQGRQVVDRCDYDYGGGNKITKHALYAIVSLEEIEKIDEAVVHKGKMACLGKPYFQKRFADIGVGHINFTMSHGVPQMELGEHYADPFRAMMSANPEREYTVAGYCVEKDVFDKVMVVLNEAAHFSGQSFYSTGFYWRNGRYCQMKTENLLCMIGEGKTVTDESLNVGCAKGETEPRLMKGDFVRITRGSEEITGVISGMAKSVTVMTEDGNKVSSVYDNVERISELMGNLSLLDESVAVNFKDALNSHKERLYRVAVKVNTVVFPMFPEKGERQTVMRDVKTCVCPSCGWQMASVSEYGSKTVFKCCVCSQQGNIVNIGEEEAILVLHRRPAKNTFCIKEAKCCGNCGLFCFETGRQGKRSTGYCKVSNQCVQGFNVCDFWFPRNDQEYSSNLKQHITNLGYGVEDFRNLSRKDGADMVYSKDDHVKEKKRAEQAKALYAVAYGGFMEKLKVMGSKAKKHGDKLEQSEIDEWSKKLEGC
jgi:hypothetical protein